MAAADDVADVVEESPAAALPPAIGKEESGDLLTAVDLVKHAKRKGPSVQDADVPLFEALAALKQLPSASDLLRADVAFDRNFPKDGHDQPPCLPKVVTDSPTRRRPKPRLGTVVSAPVLGAARATSSSSCNSPGGKTGYEAIDKKNSLGAVNCRAGSKCSAGASTPVLPSTPVLAASPSTPVLGASRSAGPSTPVLGAARAGGLLAEKLPEKLPVVNEKLPVVPEKLQQTLLLPNVSNSSPSQPPQRSRSEAHVSFKGSVGHVCLMQEELRKLPVAEALRQLLIERCGTLKQAYKTMDINGEGVVDVGDFEKGLQRSNVFGSPLVGYRGASDLFKGIDPQRQGTVSLQEFLGYTPVVIKSKKIRDTQAKWTDYTNKTSALKSRLTRKPKWKKLPEGSDQELDFDFRQRRELRQKLLDTRKRGSLKMEDKRRLVRGLVSDDERDRERIETRQKLNEQQDRISDSIHSCSKARSELVALQQAMAQLSPEKNRRGMKKCSAAEAEEIEAKKEAKAEHAAAAAAHRAEIAADFKETGADAVHEHLEADKELYVCHELPTEGNAPRASMAGQQARYAP